MKRKDSKKKAEKENVVKVSALNLAVILMAAAFIIGTYSSLDSAAVRISNSCGFFCRLNNVITGNIVLETQQTNPFFTCKLEPGASCPLYKNYADVIGLWSTTNAHASDPGSYNYQLCCNLSDATSLAVYTAIPKTEGM